MNKRASILIGLATGIIGCFITWIFMGNPPPFEIPLPALGTLWAVLNADLYLILSMINPPSYLEELLSYILVFVQWFIIGRFIWWIIGKMRKRNI